MDDQKNIIRGFKSLTLIEIIIIVGVIGLLATLAAVGVNGSQKKVRDNRRIEDMVMIRSSMQLIYNQTGTFSENTCAEGSKVADCQGAELIQMVNNLQQLRDPDSKGVSCADSHEKGCDYAFNTLTTDTYSVLFYLETGTQGFAEGPHVLTEQGIQ